MKFEQVNSKDAILKNPCDSEVLRDRISTKIPILLLVKQASLKALERETWFFFKNMVQGKQVELS